MTDHVQQHAKTRLAIAILSTCGLAGANHAWAQLEEIIVTAQKRTEDMQNVPIAITAFDAAAMDAKQITTVQDLRFTAPNVSYSKGNFTGSNFKIRGIGQDLVAATSDAGVGIHINDVPLQDPRLYETEYYDIEQLVVLRGPQGTLYGRNSTGGAVNMITNRASVEALEGNIEGQYGNNDTMRNANTVTTPSGNQILGGEPPNGKTIHLGVEVYSMGESHRLRQAKVADGTVNDH